MGIGMADIEYLSDRSLLPIGPCAVLDIGSQNLFNLTPAAAIAFARKHGTKLNSAELEAAAATASYFSSPRPGEATTYLSALFRLTPEIFYTSYDICMGDVTEIFDLNTEDLPPERRNAFDVVLNFGTTEHLINQFNAFKVMHEAVKPGGVVFHHVPSMGWMDHGYFTYHKQFFDDLIAANDYELVDHWLTPERVMALDPATTDIRDPYQPQVPRSFKAQRLQLSVQCFQQNMVLRKRHDRPFRIGLELATSHSGLSEKIKAQYRGD